jgi:hypothetical protein
MVHATQFNCAVLAVTLLAGFETTAICSQAVAAPAGVESRSILDGPEYVPCTAAGADYVGGVDATGNPVEGADAALPDNGVHVDNDFMVNVPVSRHARRGSVDVRVHLAPPGQDTRPAEGCAPSAPGR